MSLLLRDDIVTPPLCPKGQKVLGGPGHEIGNEQIEPRTDNKTVRQPGAAPGWTSPLQRRRSGAKRRTSGAAASTAPQRR